MGVENTLQKGLSKYIQLSSSYPSVVIGGIDFGFCRFVLISGEFFVFRINTIQNITKRK